MAHLAVLDLYLSCDSSAAFNLISKNYVDKEGKVEVEEETRQGGGVGTRDYDLLVGIR